MIEATRRSRPVRPPVQAEQVPVKLPASQCRDLRLLPLSGGYDEDRDLDDTVLHQKVNQVRAALEGSRRDVVEGPDERGSRQDAVAPSDASANCCHNVRSDADARASFERRARAPGSRASDASSLGS